MIQHLEQNPRPDVRYIPSLETRLRQVGVIPQGQQATISQIVPCSRAGAETFIAAFNVHFPDTDGAQDIKVAEKSIVTLGSIPEKAKRYMQNLIHLRDLGVPVPQLFGVANGAVYQGYIERARPVSDLTKERQAKQQLLDNPNVLRTLLGIGQILDNNGYQYVGSYLKDVLFDGSDVYFTDGGFDLGEEHPTQPTTGSVRAFYETFPTLAGKKI